MSHDVQVGSRNVPIHTNLTFLCALAGYEVVGEGNLIPSQWDYLGEKRIGADGDDDLVFLPCEYFSERYWRFCFHYVSISMIGTTNTLSKMCLPAKASGQCDSVCNRKNRYGYAT